MRLQTYTVIDESGIECVRPGQVVYEWPYPHWDLCGAFDVAIVVTPSEVSTIYAVPRSILQPGPEVDLMLTVREGLPPGLTRKE